MKNVLNSRGFKFSVLMLVTGLAILASGCATCPKLAAYSIQVNLDPPLKGKSVVVHLVGVNPANLPRWEAYSMASYWNQGDPMRTDSASDRVSFDFVSANSLSQTLTLTEPHWKTWKAKGVSYVLVLADTPPSHTDKPGDADDPRSKLSLDSCQWVKGTKTLTVLVQQSGIQVQTPTRQ